MPDWSLQFARRTARGFAVWAAWAVLTGRLTHDRTYGELRRIERSYVAKQLVLVALTVALLGWFATNIPAGAALWLGSGLVVGGGFGLFVVGSYFAVTWYADYSLAR